MPFQARHTGVSRVGSVVVLRPSNNLIGGPETDELDALVAEADVAGVGGLVFAPTDAPGASTQARAAFVYGGGGDFNVTGRIFVRAEYRGLVYNSPTFDLAPAVGTDRATHRAEPSIGFGYRF